MNLDYKVIGKRIKETRLLKRMTQEDVANELGISVAFLSRVERGSSQINLKRLSDLSEILDTSIAYFLTGVETTDKEYLHREFKEILDICSPTKQRLIYEVAQLIADIENK